LEYRVSAEKEKAVQVFSLTFIKSTLFRIARNYEEGDDLLNKNYFKNYLS
jgi:hypothetical protein